MHLLKKKFIASHVGFKPIILGRHGLANLCNA